MITESGVVIWRVRSAEGGGFSEAFDALILPHGASKQSGVETHTGVSVPHEGTLDDEPHTLIVRTRPGAVQLIVDYEVRGANGEVRMRGRSSVSELSVFVRSATSLLVGGLPDYITTNSTGRDNE